MGDAAAAEVGACVQRVDADQPVDVGVCGTPRGSEGLLALRLGSGVPAAPPGKQSVPNVSILGRTRAASTRIRRRVLAVLSGQERAHTSAVGRGGFVMDRFGAWRFGTDAEPGSVGPGLGARFGRRADPVGPVLQVYGELLEPLCHGRGTCAPLGTAARGPRDAPFGTSLRNKRLPLLYSSTERAGGMFPASHRRNKRYQ